MIIASHLARMFALSAFLSVPAVHAGEFIDISGSRVHLTASASQDVANDRFIALLAVERRGGNPAELAQQVNAAMTRALTIAKSFTSLQTASGGYETTPEYERGTRTGWRVSQELRLESNELAPLAAAIEKLQGELQVKSMAFAVSSARRAEVESALITRALSAFHDRAALIARGLQADSWQIVHIDVQTPGEPPRTYYSAREAGIAIAAAPPAIAPGLSTVSVTVDGEIRVQPAAH